MIDHLLLRVYFRRKLFMDKYLRRHIKEIMSSQSPNDGTSNHPKEHKGISGHHITMLSRYIIALDLVKDLKVLDTGCGLGWGSYILSLKAKEVLGVDVNENSISYAISNWKVENLNFGIYNALDLGGFPDDVIDVVTSMELIEHFTQVDGLRYLREVFRVLKPGGVFFGSSGFTNNDAKKRSMMNNSEHKYIYSEHEFKEILEGIGFKDMEVTKNWLFLARR